ncbi:unnamed protein product [Cuscuta campestris]|uniref:Uncharacterized protein n=1 Tax=Cuscuta campestris TaxID=132261 RepID=A0A484KYL5_9ASTE|nr:unnamed protein product [Cuscuta campestris]
MEDKFTGIEEKINAQDMKLDQIMLILKKSGTKSGKEKEVYSSSGGEGRQWNATSLNFNPNLEFPKFDGSNTRIWIKKACYSRWVVVELCGATTIFLDMCECGLLNVVQVYGLMCKDSRVMAGAGASDFVLYKELREFAWRAQSDHREALLKFSDSLLVVPAILAENNGFDVTSTIKKWHDDDNMMRMGINISTGAHSSIRIWDLYTSRESAVTSALDFVLSWLESMAAKELKSYIYGGL